MKRYSAFHVFTAVVAAGLLSVSVSCKKKAPPVASAMALLGSASVLRSRHLAYDWQRLWRDFRRGRDVLWSASDPWPALYSLLGAAAFSWRGLRHGVSATAATTLDIEWDGGVIA